MKTHHKEGCGRSPTTSNVEQISCRMCLRKIGVSDPAPPIKEKPFRVFGPIPTRMGNFYTHDQLKRILSIWNGGTIEGNYGQFETSLGPCRWERREQWRMAKAQ